MCVFEITLIWCAFGKYFLAVFSCILIILILLFTEHLCYFNEIKTINSLMPLVFDLRVIDLRSYLWPSKFLYILSSRNLKFYILHLGLWSFLDLFLCVKDVGLVSRFENSVFDRCHIFWVFYLFCVLHYVSWSHSFFCPFSPNLHHCNTPQHRRRLNIDFPAAQIWIITQKLY